MAYPFMKMVQLGEFKEKAVSKFGCTIQTLPFGLVGFDGQTKFEVLTSKNGTHSAVLPSNLNDDEAMTLSVLRSLCNRLDIDVKEFGLHLE